jgi:hypothetical protein
MHFDFFCKKISVASFVCKQLQRKKRIIKLLVLWWQRKLSKYISWKLKEIFTIIQSVEDYTYTYTYRDILGGLLFDKDRGWLG